MWMAAMSETLGQNFDLEEEQIKHQLSQIMEKISDSFYTESEKKRLRRLARQIMDQKAEEKKITELIKGSKTELVCYTGERIEILSSRGTSYLCSGLENTHHTAKITVAMGDYSVDGMEVIGGEVLPPEEEPVEEIPEETEASATDETTAENAYCRLPRSDNLIFSIYT